MGSEVKITHSIDFAVSQNSKQIRKKSASVQEMWQNVNSMYGLEFHPHNFLMLFLGVHIIVQGHPIKFGVFNKTFKHLMGFRLCYGGLFT